MTTPNAPIIRVEILPNAGSGLQLRDLCELVEIVRELGFPDHGSVYTTVTGTIGVAGQLRTLAR